MLNEDSDFRNKRDVVPAGIRTGPNPQKKIVFLARRREVESFLSFFSFVVCFPWELVSGRGVFL